MARQQPQTPTINQQEVDTNKNVVPTLVNIILPGTGQILKGEISKGIGFIVAFIFSLCLTIILIGMITTPIIWVWALYDAYTKPAVN